jgi:hypothetical protein
MKVTARTSVFLELEQGEARDLLHDLGKVGEGKTNTEKLKKCLAAMLPSVSMVKSSDPAPETCNTCRRGKSK